MGLTSLIILLIVIAAVVIGGYFAYQSYIKGLPSGDANYLVSLKYTFNMQDLTTLEGLKRDWKNGSPLMTIKSSKIWDDGFNPETSDNLYTKANVLITVGEFGVPKSISLTTDYSRVVLLEYGEKSIVLRCRLLDSTRMSAVVYDIVLEGCPNGVKDFTIEKLKKFPKVIRIRWYTVNKLPQKLKWETFPLLSDRGTYADKDIKASEGKDNVDVFFENFAALIRGS
jgi:hypothetical protein